MYFNGTDYYYFSGVKNVFRTMLQDDDISDKDIIYVLKAKNFPFKTISRSINGKSKLVGIYSKSVINSYFNTSEKRKEIQNILNYAYDDDIEQIVSEISQRRKYTQDDDTTNDYDKSPDDDMDYVSNQLLMDDDVMYESFNPRSKARSVFSKRYR